MAWHGAMKGWVSISLSSRTLWSARRCRATSTVKKDYPTEAPVKPAACKPVASFCPPHKRREALIFNLPTAAALNFGLNSSSKLKSNMDAGFCGSSTHLQSVTLNHRWTHDAMKRLLVLSENTASGVSSCWAGNKRRRLRPEWINWVKRRNIHYIS